MALPATIDEFLDLIRKSGVADEKRLDAHVQKLRTTGLLPPEASKLAGLLVRDGYLTHFQAEHLMQGKWRRFTIGKYKVLERLGSGGMGQVYLCEHKLMRRRVAVKVLPHSKAKDDSARERFYREARAVAALDHPNIVHAYDIDQDEELHFLVMEYVDGASFQDVVKKSGAIDVVRACHYIRQAALGLEHAHAAGLVHRDIKPGNILVDRQGVVKILDMGLARFFNDEEDILTKKYDENVLGTADYLAPEQAIDSHEVNIRADIYSLGATFFFLLTGQTPFGEGTVAQKLLWHQNRQPKPLSTFRKDIPPGLEAVLLKMMAKDRGQRYAVPGEVADALAPFVTTAIGPPPESEMPRLSPAATGATPGETVAPTAITKTPTSPVPVKSVPQAPAANRPPGPASPPPRTPPPRTPTLPPPTPASGNQPRAGAAPPMPAAHPAPSAATSVKPAVSTLPQPAKVEPLSEPAPWDAPETVDPSNQADTEAPAVGTSSRALLQSELRAKKREKRRLWTVVIVLSSVLMIAVGVLLWLFVLRQPTPAPVGPTVRLPLVVSKKGGVKAFTSIRHALSSAQPGDVIELHDPLHEETLIVEKAGPKTTDITLQAASNVSVQWVPAIKDETKPILTLVNAPGFKLKGRGITLDGALDAKRSLRDLVLITSYVGGTTIEDLTLSGFTQTAIKVMNAQGDAGRPLRLDNLKAIADPKGKALAAIWFDAAKDHKYSFNDWIEVSDSTFQGMPPDGGVKAKNATVNGKNVTWPKLK